MTVFLRKNNQKPRHNRHKLSLLQRLLVQGERFEAPLQFLPGTDYTDKHGKRINLIHVIRIIRALVMSASKLNFVLTHSRQSVHLFYIKITGR